MNLIVDEIDTKNHDRLRTYFDGGAALQAVTIYDYWVLHGQKPERAYELAIAAWTDNAKYERMKRGDE